MLHECIGSGAGCLMPLGAVIKWVLVYLRLTKCSSGDRYLIATQL